MPKSTSIVLCRRIGLAGIALCAGLAVSEPSVGECTAGQPSVVYTFDARSLNHLDLRVNTNAHQLWDTLHAVAALQGLANRESPRLYLFYCADFGLDTDQFWFDWFRGEDGWLKNVEVQPINKLEDLFETFRKTFKGLVVYDPAVPATSNLGSTAAGCEDLIPVRFDPTPGSLYDRLVVQLRFPVKLWLLNPDGTSKFTGRGVIPDSDEPSSGSTKIDCYRWALRRYLRAGLCAPGIAAYYIDAFWTRHPQRAGPTMHTLSNHDYFIARRAFFFDLSPWGDEAPNDDSSQPSGLEQKQFLRVLRALYDRAQGRMIQVGGFPPWPYKYTSHAQPQGKHEGVPTEWEFGRIISQFNGYMEADAAGIGAMANASFFQHYPLADHYPQPNAKPDPSMSPKRFLDGTGKVRPKLFVGHYVGDYDAPSWLYKAVPAFFRDPALGQVPLGWAFDPNLSARAPQALVYAYRHATTNDFFIAGDSGAGYLNPRALTVRPDSGLPPGLDFWITHCARHYQRWGMTITGFVLDGSGGGSTESEFAAYRTFSADGAGTHFEKGPRLFAGIPTCPERDLPDNVAKAASVIADIARQGKGRTTFLWARSILKPPRWYADLSRLLREEHPDLEIDVVDPYTFFGLIRLHLANTRK